ncbi:recombinase family protein [Roseobacter sp. CCS2]|uniref:recombinase family protein n=1 Tax=Roseobacter sp. CCS2 TaxID=391593 RepID=UPI0002F02376|nr:recombinase family protein [Roseobacter sp. CCS2]
MTTKTCFAYTRVSTVKQGDGVSLEAQREAITIFAQRNNLTVIEWFEEKETAAKRGRPVFDAVVQSLQAGNAVGLIAHKIDRSARNFSDWARIGELVDSGIDVHFAHESLDLRSRGGRLTADIQAVIAADYVRNLREETLKGIEGRLKQGLFPFGAPIGYLNTGPGQPKKHDPMRAPFVRQAFELYASQQFSLRGLVSELERRGLRNRHGKPVTKYGVENILSNRFYYGTIYLKRTNRMYSGIHEPIITKALFDRVQALKKDRHHKKHVVHNHRYRRLISCGLCHRRLYGEVQKGHVYIHEFIYLLYYIVTASTIWSNKYNETRSSTYQITTKIMHRETITLDCRIVQDCVDSLDTSKQIPYICKMISSGFVQQN